MGLPLVGVVAVLLVLGGASLYFYARYSHAQRLLKDPTAAAGEEISALTKKVGRHIELPDNEVPTVATVSDTSKLADQPFFAKAQVGDKVLIYTQAGKAILFRPGANKIIEVMVVNLGPAVAGTSSATAQAQSAKLTIYNGTQTAGLASVAERKIKGALNSIQTTAKLNSASSFDKSVVVVLTPEAQSLGTKLAELFQAGITTAVPAGEAKPNTELLLILGQDYRPE